MGVWVVDPGIESVLRSGRVETERGPAWVGLAGLDGTVARRLDRPLIRALRDAPFHPGALAVVEGVRGPEPWLADAYGSGHIHRYDADGAFIDSVDASGLDPPGFLTPHALATDGRDMVYAADRGHGRMVAIDPSGVAIRSFGEGVLARPSSIAPFAGDLLVADLDGQISVFERSGRLRHHVVGQLRRSHGTYWPNAGRRGQVRAPRGDQRRAIRSPDALAVRRDGTMLGR